MENVKKFDLVKVSKKAVFAALFVVLAVALPQLVHLTGGSDLGRTLLPMQLPVIMCGLILGGFYGFFAGTSAALVSFLLTGMPNVTILPIIALEISAYGFVAGLLNSRKINVFLTLATALFVGRLLVFWYTVLFTPMKSYVFDAAAAGYIGIIIQIVLIPVIMYFYNNKKKN